jgi:signal transduction histidine kinase
LAQIAAQLEDGNAEQTADTLRRMATVLSAERADLRKLVEGMNRRLEEIRGILHAQHDYARSGGLTQHTLPQELVDDALAQSRHAIRAQNVELQCSVEELPEIDLDRNRLLQVLANLIKNALESLAEARPPERHLVIRAYAERGRLIIEVEDNGLGFDEATRTQLFRSGFTTKTSGQGLGLHFCFNTLQELGGEIRASSEGRGKGAKFVIALPAEELRPSSAATVKIEA